MFFQYGTREIDYLKSSDKILGNVIDKIGHIERTIDTDLFSSVIRHSIGQQISSAAQRTILERMNKQLGRITKDTIYSLSIDEIQKFGMTFKKAEYIKNFSNTIKYGERFGCLRRFGGPNKKTRSVSRADKLCRSNGVEMERSGMT
ncbi:putative DNA-3-methyladenine glycosylase II [Hollandina sp. SP2]